MIRFSSASSPSNCSAIDSSSSSSCSSWSMANEREVKKVNANKRRHRENDKNVIFCFPNVVRLARFETLENTNLRTEPRTQQRSDDTPQIFDLRITMSVFYLICTGANRGIGLAITKRLATANTHVIAVGRRSSDELEAACSEVGDAFSAFFLWL